MRVTMTTERHGDIELRLTGDEDGVCIEQEGRCVIVDRHELDALRKILEVFR